MIELTIASALIATLLLYGVLLVQQQEQPTNTRRRRRANPRLGDMAFGSHRLAAAPRLKRTRRMVVRADDTDPGGDEDSFAGTGENDVQVVVPEIRVTVTEVEEEREQQGERRRVRFNEEMRMQSYGGTHYVGRVVDKDRDGETEK
jgi:hypothetical protein